MKVESSEQWIGLTPESSFEEQQLRRLQGQSLTHLCVQGEFGSSKVASVMLFPGTPSTEENPLAARVAELEAERDEANWLYVQMRATLDAFYTAIGATGVLSGIKRIAALIQAEKQLAFLLSLPCQLGALTAEQAPTETQIVSWMQAQGWRMIGQMGTYWVPFVKGEKAVAWPSENSSERSLAIAEFFNELARLEARSPLTVLIEMRAQEAKAES